jgi:predicted DNA-binding transcriptional regulator
VREAGPHPAELTQRQAAVYAQITAYHAVTHEGCPVTYLARRLKLHHETVRDYVAVLFRKGWLKRETSPAEPVVGFLTRKR